jgi:hypothetical protein
MNIYNMTPHPITIVGEDNNVIKIIPCSGWELRLTTETKQVDVLDGIPITITVYGRTQCIKGKSFNGQTDPWANVNLSTDRFIVSQLIKSAFGNSPLYDCLLVPAEMLRDENGQIIGCRSLGV